MKPLPCSDATVLLPEVCPAADPRCTGCARQPGIFAGLLRAIKRSCGLVRAPAAGIDLGAALRSYVLLHVYGAAHAPDDAGCSGGLSPDDYRLTMGEIIWADTREWVSLGGGCEDRMPAVYLVAMLRYYMDYSEDSPAVRELMRTREYRAGIRRVEAQLTMRARELGLDRLANRHQPSPP